MAKELTPEEMAAKIAELQAENKDLKKANKEATKKVAKLTNEVPGSFKHENGIVKFKKGFVAFKISWKGKVQKIESVEALKDAELMNHLVEIGFGGIEIVEPSK